jgi:hypothetical protein
MSEYIITNTLAVFSVPVCHKITPHAGEVEQE